MRTNEDRADTFADVLNYYPGDAKEALIDLLTDAMHYCDLNRIPFDGALQAAREYFGHEKEGA